MWEPDTGKWYVLQAGSVSEACPDTNDRNSGIIDFEMWQEKTATSMNETRELQRWGLAEAPAPRGWFDAWAMQYGER